MTASGYVLFWEAQSGAIAPQVMFEEMSIPYEKRPVDMAAGEHKTKGYLDINPTGQVPALRLPEGVVIGESAAIVQVLGERHPQAALVALAGEPDRPEFLRWLSFMAASIYMTYVRANHPERFTTDGSSTEPIRQVALEQIEEQFRIVDEAIAGKPYFLARGFSALDIYLTMLTVWHPDKAELFVRNRRLGALCTSVEARPAYARVIREHLGA